MSELQVSSHVEVCPGDVVTVHVSGEKPFVANVLEVSLATVHIQYVTHSGRVMEGYVNRSQVRPGTPAIEGS